MDGNDSEGKDARDFVDIGANVNTMSIRKFIPFLDEKLNLDFLEGPFRGLEVKFGE